MSTDAPAAATSGRAHDSALLDVRSAQTLRYAFGVTVSASLAFSIAWPLYFLTPVLTAVFLAKPLPAPSVRNIAVNFVHTLTAFALGVSFTLLLLPYPLLYTVALGLALFHIYYLANRGGPFWLVLVSLIAVLLLPMVGMTHDALASGVAYFFVFSCALALVVVFLAHRLIPDPAGSAPNPSPRSALSEYSAPAANRALKSTLVILPLAVLFVAGSLSGQVLVLVFAAIFSLSPDIVKGRAAGRASFISTLVGGAAALVFYVLIVALPELHFFVALMLLATLLFGAGIFAGRAFSPYLSSAATAMIILVGSAMGEDVDIADEFAVRVLLIVLATLYVVAALAVLERVVPGSAANNASLS